MDRIRILMADDEPDFLNILRFYLRENGWLIETAEDGLKALELLTDTDYDLALLDLYMPGRNGVEVVQAAREGNVHTDFILMTGDAAREGALQKALEAGKMGALAFLKKPFGPNRLIHAIRNVLEYRLRSSHRLAGRVDEFLKEEYRNPSLHLSDIATEIGISSGYICKLLRKYRGANFRERLAYHRTQGVKALLESTGEPLKTIAGRCGFRNRQRLTEAFCRVEGMSPKKYRKMCAGRRAMC